MDKEEEWPARGDKTINNTVTAAQLKPTKTRTRILSGHLSQLSAHDKEHDMDAHHSLLH